MARMMIGGLACLAVMAGPALADDAKPSFPTMAPAAQYAMASPDAEIALARSAAPASISADAEILVLGAHNYETAVKGKNGFVCLVLRSWTAGASDPRFWDPAIRGPACLNPAAARSVLPHIQERTQWALSGVSNAGITERIKAQLTARTFTMPEPGAMCYMMSKEQALGGGGHWHPHVMFYVAADDAAMGANLTGSPIISGRDDPTPVTIFMIPVEKWSDGTPETMVMK
jgi:hypothetical protein